MALKLFRYITLWIFAIILPLLIGHWFAAYSQTSSEDDSRGMKAKEFAKGLQNRILASRPKSTKPKPVKNVRYAASDPDDAPISQGIDIGVTFWQLRESTKGDDPAIVEKRSIVRKKGRTASSTLKMTPMCAESDLHFKDEDLLRMAFEIPIEGYIYIFNREQYADGTLSEPTLIFPSAADFNKTDRSIPGKLFFIPNGEDYFEIKRSEKGDIEKTGEVLILMIASQRFKELPPLGNNEEQRGVDAKLFESWERAWSGRTWKFVQEGKAGTAITKIEKNAAATGTEILTGSDYQLPQTIYHIENKPGNPLLFSIPVRIGR